MNRLALIYVALLCVVVVIVLTFILCPFATFPSVFPGSATDHDNGVLMENSSPSIAFHSLAKKQVRLQSLDSSRQAGERASVDSTRDLYSLEATYTLSLTESEWSGPHNRDPYVTHFPCSDYRRTDAA
eukprot:m.126200 g.126200  ORF g.126200 m.126200 type:complete len:128 (+) comp37893_c1_seq5:134-517(+)